MHWNYIAEQRRMCQIISSSKRGGYTLLSGFFSWNSRANNGIPDKQLVFFFQSALLLLLSQHAANHACALTIAVASFALSWSRLFYLTAIPTRCQLGTDCPNRIIELEWAVKNNKDFIPTPKPPRREKKKEKKKRNVEDWSTENNTTGLNGEENDYGLSGMEMQMNEKMNSSSQNHTHHHKLGDSSATEFGVEITNTTSHGSSAIHATVSGSSPRLCKRLYTVVEDENEYDDRTSEKRTPKKVKITGLEELDSSVSEDEVEVEVWREKILPVALKERDIVASS